MRSRLLAKKQLVLQFTAIRRTAVVAVIAALIAVTGPAATAQGQTGENAATTWNRIASSGPSATAPVLDRSSATSAVIDSGCQANPRSPNRGAIRPSRG